MEVIVDRFDRVVDLQQIAQAFALLQAKVGSAPLRFCERTAESARAFRKRIDNRGRHRVRDESVGPRFRAAAESVVHQRLSEGAISAAYGRQHALGKPSDRDRDVGEATLATGIFSGETVELGEKRRDRRQRGERLDERRPLRGAAE